ncbi:MAG TPA: thiamine pyrophosphate-binding protein, partial [Bacillota bacterium]|nr:thiamine pyrophosphate-binding protein [Bacillota bacterium]
MTGAEITVQVLKKHGVDTVFGLPGAAVLSLYDALYRDGRIHHVLCTHEENCAFAADGYARASGKAGVVLATSGPGATNLVTAIANAYMDSIPLVAITGNVPAASLGRDSFQEIDIAGVTMPITKHNMIVKSADALEKALTDAFTVALSGRKGPVLVDVTSNCFEEEAEYGSLEKALIPLPEYNITDALALIEKSASPLICAGGGVISANAAPELFSLAKKLHCPVALTNMGIGAYPADDEQYVGLAGMQIPPAFADALRKCDLFIALGLRFSDRLITNLDSYAPGLQILHIDIDLAEISKVIKAYSYIRGDVKQVLSSLIGSLPERKGAFARTCASSQPENAFLKRIFAFYNSQDKHTLYSTDVGLHQLWAVNSLHINMPRTFFTSGGLGAMGYGLPAAIGASIAYKSGVYSVVFSGDGSFLMSSNELITAVREKLNITVVVFNNTSLGMVRFW